MDMKRAGGLCWACVPRRCPCPCLCDLEHEHYYCEYIAERILGPHSYHTYKITLVKIKELKAKTRSKAAQWLILQHLILEESQSQVSVKLCTSIIRAVTKDVSSMRFWVLFLFIYPCEIPSCQRIKQCKEIWKLRQAENKEETRLDQRRQQLPELSCLACVASSGGHGAGWQPLRPEAALESAHLKACRQDLLLAKKPSIANRAWKII